MTNPYQPIFDEAKRRMSGSTLKEGTHNWIMSYENTVMHLLETGWTPDAEPDEATRWTRMRGKGR